MKKTFSLLFCCLCALSANATRFYVNQNATGTGTSWANAYTTIQEAFSLVISGDEIWVAKGNYKPTTTTDRTISFIIPAGVKVYGGFAGTETTLVQRQINNNPTLLNGDIGVVGDPSDNSCHVVRINNGGVDTKIDGFRIVNGNANLNSTSGADRYGAGVYVVNGSPVFSQCIIANNTAAAAGGGIYLKAGSPTFDDCNINNNAALQDGGAVHTYDQTTLKMLNCRINSNNAAAEGGAIYAYGTFIMDRCIVSGNTGNGSCIMVATNVNYGKFTIYNSLIAGNLVQGTLIKSSTFLDSQIINCTVVNNSNYSTTNFSLGGTVNGRIVNSIFWDNKRGDCKAYTIYNTIFESVSVAVSAALLNVNPQLVSPDLASNAPFVVNNTLDYRLLPNSSAIGHGRNSEVNTGYNFDLDGTARIKSTIVDAGCYESIYVSTESAENTTPNTIAYANDNIYIAENEALRGQKLYIYGINGVLLQTKTIDSDIITLQNLASGTYIATTQNQSLKFVVVK
jgi:hypothetical protein